MGKQHRPEFAKTVEKPSREGGYVREASLGLDERVGNAARVQALTIGCDSHYDGDGGPESYLGSDCHAVGMRYSNEPSDESGFWGGIQAFDAGVTGIVGDNQVDLGYRADLIGGEVGVKQIDDDSSADRGVRLSGSFGAPNFGIRVSSGDADSDGRSELRTGLTVPVGPVGVGVDKVSERPFGDAAVDYLDEMSRPLFGMPMATLADEAAAWGLGEENRPSLQLDDAVRDGMKL